MSALQDKSQKEESISRRITELEDRLENIGGIDKYQQASIISTSHFKTSRLFYVHYDLYSSPLTYD